MMSSFFRRLLPAVICLVLALQALAVPSVHAAYVGEIYSRLSSDIPAIDGVIGATEWANSNVYDKVGDEERFTVYLMHEESFFYIGLKIRGDFNSSASVNILFDEGDDGSYGSGSGDEVLKNGQEDWKRILANGTLRDGFWDTTRGKPQYYFLYNEPPEAVNFEAAIKHSTDHWEVEFKIPFVGNDGHVRDKSDLNIKRTDAPGIAFNLVGSRYYYPKGFDYSKPSSFLGLKFDNEPPRITNVNYTPKNPQPTDDVAVTADVTDTVSGVKQTVLRYSIDNGKTWTEIVMTGGPTYRTIIPKQIDETIVKYQIQATDRAGLTIVDYYTDIRFHEAATVTSTEGPRPICLPLVGCVCLIATATYGSELSPEVQQLRSFRDNLILKTKSGSAFMVVFNIWYYSFSPTVAQFISEHSTVRTVAKFMLYPLIGILAVGAAAFHLFPMNLEAGAVISGLVVSSLIGTVYLAMPLAAALAHSSRVRRIARKLQLPIVAVLFSAVAAVATLTMAGGPAVMMMLAASTIVLATLIASALVTSAAILRGVKAVRNQ